MQVYYKCSVTKRPIYVEKLSLELLYHVPECWISFLFIEYIFLAFLFDGSNVPFPVKHDSRVGEIKKYDMVLNCGQILVFG